MLATPLGLLSTLPYDNGDGLTGGGFQLAVVLGGPALIGRLLRGRAALHSALREKAALLERRREDAAGRAVVDERARIAGELHDVVAHALSAMTVQATGARRLALTRPELARAAFEAIERSGREALDELRRLLGVLRREDAELTLAPQPSLRHVHSLVRRTTAAGLPVTLRVEGTERELAAGLDVTAYRVVQEALAAALDVGGAGRADVRLRFGADVLEIDVRDDGPLLTARPLTGVRERVVLHGGRLNAGRRRSGGGHIVHATLPLDGQTMPREEPEEPPCELARGRDALRDAAVRALGLGRAGTAHADAVSRPAARLRGVAGRMRRADLFDALLAAGLALAAVLEVAVSPDRDGPLLANLLVALGYSVPLAWRRRSTLAATVVVLGATLLMGLTLSPVQHLFVPFVTVLMCAYACGAHREGRASVAGLVLVVGALPVIIATMDDRVAGDYVFPTLIGAVAWLAGRAVRARTRLAAELHEATARLAEATEEEQQLAATEERRRIARELHDLVAHSMSVMVVQAGGARRILDRDPGARARGRDADRARRPRGAGRDAPPARRPQRRRSRPRARAAADARRDRRADRPRPVGGPADRPRIPRRAPRPTRGARPRRLSDRPGRTHQCPQARRPRAHDRDRRLERARTDAGGPRSRGGARRARRRGGHGLVGMRERVRLYGGELDAGPADGGGWRVRAVLPVGERELSLA